MRILLVSNDAQVRQQVKTALLGREGVSFFEVSTPQRALQQLDDEGPWDIVVGDNDMAPTGGFYLAREVKARGQMGRDMPPVVLLLARRDDRWLSNWSQADAYVLKPLDPFDLAEVVESLVAGTAVPALPGIGGEPTPSLLDLPAEAGDAVATARRPDEGGLRESGGQTGEGP